MLIRLRHPLTEEELAAILSLCREEGCEPRLLDGQGRLLEVEGPARPELRSRLEDLVGVESVLDAGNARERFLRGPGAARPSSRSGARASAAARWA